MNIEKVVLYAVMILLLILGNYMGNIRRELLHRYTHALDTV